MGAGATIRSVKIRLVMFATARDAVGSDEIEIELSDGARLGDLQQTLLSRYPDLAAIWPRLAVAVDGELADSGMALADGCEVALLPPVSGGAPEARAQLIDDPIDVTELCDRFNDPAHGALVLFAGTVRNHHRGRQVTKITYDAYRPMAHEVLNQIVTEIEADTPELRLIIVHRLGDVPVGDASVVIAAASPHRDAAFQASRAALERLKREAPIWKLEHYADGQTCWREEEPLAV